MKLRTIGAGVAAAAAAYVSAQAHHPGSHADRQRDGRVRIDAVAMAPDACTTIAEIRLGAPSGVTPPPGSAPVTVRLKREGQVCAAVVTAVRGREILDVQRAAQQIHLYFQAPDGSLTSTERFPIR
jgi:hypothetical protein